MTTVNLDAPVSERPIPGITADLPGNKDDAIALRLRSARSSFSGTMQLLSAHRREAMYALHAFCREVEDIAASEASRALKYTLLGNWRSEIALLYAGRPQHLVSCALSEPVRQYSLQCADFLVIIDGMEMDARTNIRAPSLSELDLYCERVAVSVGRLSVRILGEGTPAGDRVAAELGRALQLTNILRTLAEDARRQRAVPAPRSASGARHPRNRAQLGVAQPALPDVCRDVARLAEGHYAAAAQAIAACPRGTMPPGRCDPPHLSSAPPRASRARLEAP
jgi:presqualene diphosphate synthase